jgi:hypothetical protein
MLNRHLPHALPQDAAENKSCRDSQRQTQQNLAFSYRYYRKLCEMQNPVEALSVPRSLRAVNRLTRLSVLLYRAA